MWAREIVASVRNDSSSLTVAAAASVLSELEADTEVAEFRGEASAVRACGADS